MGTWGYRAYDNDSANDWAYGLDGVGDLSLVDAAFDEVEEVDAEYLDADIAHNALAACEVLARCLGNVGYENSYTEKVDEWVAAHPCKPSAAQLKRANAVIDRILGEESELRSLWREGHPSEWLAAVEELRSRLSTTP